MNDDEKPMLKAAEEGDGLENGGRSKKKLPEEDSGSAAAAALESSSKRSRLDASGDEDEDEEEDDDEDYEVKGATVASAAADHHGNHGDRHHHHHRNQIFINSDIQNPRQFLAHLLPSFNIDKLPANMSDLEITRLIYQIMSSASTTESGGENGSPPRIVIDPSSLFVQQYRHRLEHFNTIEHATDLIRSSKNIIVLTGAGCSVSCGIPDFR